MLPKNKCVIDFKEEAYMHLNELRNLRKSIYSENKRIDDDDNSDYSDDNYNFEEEFKSLQSKMDEILSMNERNNEEMNEEINYNIGSIYSYENEKILKKNLNEYLKKNPGNKKVHICPYQINTSVLLPFLQYFLMKMPSDHPTHANILKFITFDELTDFYKIVNKSYKILETVFLSYMKVAYYQYKGFIERNDEIYLFFDCTQTKIGTHCLHNNNNDLWLVLIDEIINSKKMCNYNIDDDICNLFLENPELIYLLDSNKVKYELPVSVYSWKEEKQIEFVAMAGLSRNENNSDAIMGRYYYYTNYENSLKSIENINKRKGIIRFAIFLGNMKVPLNLKEDNSDLSEKTKSILLNDITTTTEEYKITRDLLRVSDRDGLWAEDYDSVFIGKFLLDDGCEYKKNPIWVIKNYEQQIPLTYHIIKS
jgi:hypothetical protein